VTNQEYNTQSAQVHAKMHGVELGTYLDHRLSSNLYDLLAHLIIVHNGDVKEETARPYLASIRFLTCRVLDDVIHPK
jgi:hypothetical protein